MFYDEFSSECKCIIFHGVQLYNRIFNLLLLRVMWITSKKEARVSAYERTRESGKSLEGLYLA